MSIVLPALAVAFAAFCVRLGVRIVNRRERWAKWTAVGLLIGLPLLYVASFGPACGLVARRQLDRGVAEQAYGPILWAYAETPFGRILDMREYGEFWMPKDAHFILEVMPPDGIGYGIPFFGR